MLQDRAGAGTPGWHGRIDNVRTSTDESRVDGSGSAPPEVRHSGGGASNLTCLLRYPSGDA